MARPLNSDDQDQLHLDNLIALGGDIIEFVQKIKDLSDEPDILLLALKIESSALIIQKRVRDYRPRLIGLKRAVKQAEKAKKAEGKDGRDTPPPRRWACPNNKKPAGQGGYGENKRDG